MQRARNEKHRNSENTALLGAGPVILNKKQEVSQ